MEILILAGVVAIVALLMCAAIAAAPKWRGLNPPTQRTPPPPRGESTELCDAVQHDFGKGSRR